VCDFIKEILGSGALSGLMLDLGLLKISLGAFLPISIPCGGFNPAGLYTYPFPNPVGQS